ncbi:cytochrome P450 [Paraphoma chrysanthemicola]|nr:cytochrome P450 [Paraphoma chrysanthemicola]
MFSFTQLGSVLVLVLAAFLSSVAHSIWFHPLAKYPGPFLARATDFLYWYHWLQGQLPYYAEQAHQRYGPVVRLGPTRISFIEPEVWRDLHGHKTASKTLQVVKDPAMYVDSPHLTEHSLLSEANDDKHGRLRKIFSHGFSDRALKAQEHLIRAHVDKLVSNIHREASQNNEIDVVKYFNCATFDIIGELSFGESLGLLENSELNAWVESILYGLEDAAFYSLLLEYPLLGRIVNFFLSEKMKEASAKNAKYSEDRVRKRMEKGNETEKPDFWTLVLSQHESGVLNFEQMKSNADLFMQAGSETTATMLSGLMYNLLLNPEKMKKAVEEVRSSFRNEGELTIEGIQRLRYLDACFNESMRIYPSTPVGPPRVVVTPGVVCGDVLPVGTRASIAIMAAYHSPNNFKDPMKFVPERWIESTSEYTEYANDRRAIFQPFSVGPRNCIGKNLALHEMRLIACKMLWHFDFQLCDENRGNWYEQKCFWALWSKPPLWVRATAKIPSNVS